MRVLIFSLISMCLFVIPVCATPGADNQALSRVADALEAISTLVRPGRVGYANFWDGNKYVQCRRTPQLNLRCEASGSRLQPSLRHVLTAERQNRLNELRWIPDPTFGNFVQTFEPELSLQEVASLIVIALEEGYAAQVSQLMVEATWIDDVACPPRNGWSQNLAGIVSGAEALQSSAIKECSFLPELASELPRKSGSAKDLIETYGLRATNEIRRLRVNVWHRSFVVFSAGIGYVQCAPEPSLQAIYCEAQSADSWPALTAVLTTERVEKLKAAGFAEPGRAPNYWKTYPLIDVSDSAIASEILTILHDVYGYSGAVQLEISTD